MVSASVVAAAVAALGFCNSVHAQLYINEVYGDAGFDASSVYSADYVELYNGGASAVNMTGMNVEYGSATGAVGANTFEFWPLPSVSLPAGDFFLIKLAGGTLGAALPVTPDEDYSNTAVYSKPSFSSGKIALISASGGVLDYFGYNTSASSGTWPAYWGTGHAPGPLSDSMADVRRSYTGDNATDWVYGTPNPKNSAAVAAPEPASIGMLVSGATILMVRRRRNAK